MAILSVQVLYGEKGVKALLPRLPNADQDAGGEGDARFARCCYSGQTRRRFLDNTTPTAFGDNSNTRDISIGHRMR